MEENKSTITMIQITSMIPFVSNVGANQLLLNVKSVLEKNGYKFDIFVLNDNKHYKRLSKTLFSHTISQNKNINYVSESDFFDIYKDENRKIFFFNNSNICTKYSKKSKKQETVDELWNEDKKYLIEPLKNKTIIWFEHGPHSNFECNYVESIKRLQEQNNKIVVWSNYKSLMNDFYVKNNIMNFMTRQAFSNDLYGEIKKSLNQSKTIFCFCGRYVTTKRPQILFNLLKWTLNTDLSFEVHFRGTKTAPFLFVNKHFFDDPRFIMNDQTEYAWQQYDNKDYCFYFGNNIKTERGKIEYALLEPIYYGIPIVTIPKYFDEFMYDEYSITKEELKKCLIEYSDETFKKILDKTFDYSSYVENSKKIILSKFFEENFMKIVNKSLKESGICI